MYHAFLSLTDSTILFKTITMPNNQPGIALLFAMSTIYRGTSPYVLEILDNPFSIAGYNYSIFMRRRNEIADDLSSPLCKKILCANTPTLEFMEKNFSKQVAKKCVLSRTGVELPIVRVKKKNKNEPVRLLFVGSTTNPQDFYSKGGLETIEFFERICQQRNIHLTVRCKVPHEISERIRHNKKISLIEKEIPFAELQDLYLSADIFILPGHHFHLMAMLEAMSYGLPVIALDTYAFSDYVIDGYNGFLVEKSTQIQGYNDPSYPCNVRSETFMKEIKKIDERVIDDLSDRVLRLVDNEKLREKMGNNSVIRIAKHFSIEQRNSHLKKIFDSALR